MDKEVVKPETDFLAEARALKPPKRQNKNDPRVAAQHSLFFMLNGEAVALPEAQYRAIPGWIKRYGLRRIRIRRKSFVFGMHCVEEVVLTTKRYLISCGWRASTASCESAPEGRGNASNGSATFD